MDPIETSLDFSPGEFQRHLAETIKAVEELYQQLESKRTIPAASPGAMKELLQEALPLRGMAFAPLLGEVRNKLFPNATWTVGPNYYGFITSGGNHAGVLGEMLRAALNQNPAKWIIGPGATEIELLVLRWIAEFIGYPVDSGGVLVSGGSEANLTCLKTARDHVSGGEVQMKGMHHRPQLTMYVSAEGHSCLEKSADMLGIGKEHLRKIPVTEHFTIDLAELESRIEEDTERGFLPFCVVGNAGTVNTGAVDPLDRMADIAKKHSLWFHVDAAYGGPAANTSLVREVFTGLGRADSVATDAHKWLYAPFEAGIAFVRDGSLLRRSFSNIPEYLREHGTADRTDPTEYHFQLSRDFKALKLWVAFKAYGVERIKSAIEANIRVMRHCADAIDAAAEFERLAPVPLSIVCFRYRTSDPRVWEDNEYLSQLNRRILLEVERDGRVFVSGTVIKGQQVLRACSVNHRTRERHVEYMLSVVREVGERVHKELRPVEAPHAVSS